MKVGQEVYLEDSVTYDWRSSKKFIIKHKVEKTTKTQFTAGGRRFRKDDMREIGSNAYFSKASLNGVDQSNEMNEFKLSISLGRELLKKCEMLQINIGASSEGLKSALVLFEEIEAIVKK